MTPHTELESRTKVSPDSRPAAAASAALIALTAAGCLTARFDPAPKLANSTDEAMYATLWSGARSDPGFIAVRPNREVVLLGFARNDETGCLTDGGWHTLDIYDRNPEPDIDGDVEREDLLADPVYTHDIEQDPLCGGETWTWDGDRLVRTD